MANVGYMLLVWFLGSAVARILSGAGLAIGGYVLLEPILNEFVGEVVTSLSGVAPAMASIMWIAGVGQALSMILSAIAARMAIMAGMVFIGRG